MDNGQRRGFTTGDEYLGEGYHWDQKMVLPAAEFNAIPEGPVMAPNSRHVEGAFVKYDYSSEVYRIENGQKRPMLYFDVLRSRGYGADDGKIFIAELHSGSYWRLDQLPTGANLLLRGGTLVSDSSTGTIFATDGSVRRPFLSDEALQALGYTRADVMVIDGNLLNSYAQAPRSDSAPYWWKARASSSPTPRSGGSRTVRNAGSLPGTYTGLGDSRVAASPGLPIVR